MQYLQELNRDVLSKYDCFTVGEVVYFTKDVLSYVDELSMVFHFDHMFVDNIFKWIILPFKLRKLKKVLSKWQYEINGKWWNTLYLENHDQPRCVSRFGDDIKYRVESSKMLATMIFSTRYTIYLSRSRNRHDKCLFYRTIPIS